MCDVADLEALSRLLSGGARADHPGFSLTSARSDHTLGIDIGTFESKGVLVDASGRIVARPPPAPDDRAPAGLGRAPGGGGLVGRFRASPAPSSPNPRD
jgi:hypothetical protein